MGRMLKQWGERVRRGALTEARGALAIMGSIVILFGLASFLIPDSRPMTMVYRIALLVVGGIHIVLFLWARVHPRAALVTATFFVGLLFVAQFIWEMVDPERRWLGANWLLFFPLAYGMYVGLGRRRHDLERDSQLPLENDSADRTHP